MMSERGEGKGSGGIGVGYIEDQQQFSGRKGSLGPWGSIRDNGCGAVALHNLLYALGRSPGIAPIIRTVRRQWPFSTVAGGKMGVSPLFILAYLHRHGCAVRLYRYMDGKRRERVHKRFKASLQEGRRGVYLILYFWGTGRRLGAHYQMALSDGRGRLITHNERHEDSGFAGFIERKRAQEGLRAILIFAVRRAGKRSSGIKCRARQRIAQRTGQRRET